MPRMTVQVPGYLTFPDTSDPGALTDHAIPHGELGIVRFDGREFWGEQGAQLNFYAPIATPVLYDGQRTRLTHIAATFETWVPPAGGVLEPKVFVTRITAFDRGQPILDSDPLNLTGDYSDRWAEGENSFRTSYGGKPVIGSISVRISVNFKLGGAILFTGAAASFALGPG